MNIKKAQKKTTSARKFPRTGVTVRQLSIQKVKG